MPQIPGRENINNHAHLRSRVPSNCASSTRASNGRHQGTGRFRGIAQSGTGTPGAGQGRFLGNRLFSARSGAFAGALEPLDSVTRFCIGQAHRHLFGQGRGTHKSACPSNHPLFLSCRRVIKSHQVQDSVRQEPPNFGYQWPPPTSCLASRGVERDDDITEKVWRIERLCSDVPLDTE